MNERTKTFILLGLLIGSVALLVYAYLLANTVVVR
jgi:hypothetical protein